MTSFTGPIARSLQQNLARGSSTFGASSTPFDLADRRLNYAPSDFDRRDLFQSNWVYDLPFGSGRTWANHLNPVLDRVVGGWEIAGVLIAESGRPTTVYSPAYTISNVVRAPANCNACSPDMFTVLNDGNGSLNCLTPQQMAKFSTPAPGAFSIDRELWVGSGKQPPDDAAVGKVFLLKGLNVAKAKISAK